MDFHETPGMTAPSRTIVLTRAKARAMGIPLSDLLGPGFTRLFHDTYVSSSRVITCGFELARSSSDSRARRM